MKTRTIVTALGLGSALLLAACDAKQQTEDGQADAGGRILDRSITDDMLPYDTVRSRPPAAQITPEPGSSGASGGSASATGGPADSAATDDASGESDAAEETGSEDTGDEE